MLTPQCGRFDGLDRLYVPDQFFPCVIEMMVNLCDDTIWQIVKQLRGHEIVRASLVCSRWKQVFRRVTQAEWRTLYCERVCSWLVVHPQFDWGRAVIAATAHVHAINAVCVWNRIVVHIVSPWKHGWPLDDEIDAALRQGVRRLDPRTDTVDFMYNDILRLRALRKTCYQRNTSQKCINCQLKLVQKRRCLRPTYEYYLRAIKSTSTTQLHQALSHLLCCAPSQN